MKNSSREMNNIQEILKNPNEVVKIASRTRLLNFARYMQPNMVVEPFHRVYYSVLDMFAHGKIKKLIVQQPPQHGKAIKVDTPVLTTKGWKMHGDLQPGDYVFGEDGKPKRVLNNFGSYEWHTQEVVFADGFSVRCAREHEWQIWADHDNHKGRVKEQVETHNIFSKRHRRNPFIKADAVLQGEKKSLPIDPYLLGLWLGDGISASGNIISGEEDINYYRTLSYWDKIYNNRERYYRLHVPGLSKALRENNLIHNKHIPMQYLLSSEEQRWELLRGLMDTDGYCDTRGNCEFCQKESQLASDVYILLRTLGIKARSRKYAAMLNGKKCGNKIRISFNPDKTQYIFKIPRKQARIVNKPCKDREDKKRFFITSVIDKENCVVNCIEVEGGMYLVGRELVPTHNSEGSSRKLPAFMLGLDPDKKIVIGSYAATIAQDFNRDVQKIIDTKEYRELFPETYLNGATSKAEGTWQRNSNVIDMVGHRGGLRVVGRGGALTSKTADVVILDDVYKDYREGSSPIVREAAWKWYTSVVKTRLHNDSQELIVFTRWHEDDLIGRIAKQEKIIDVQTWQDLQDIPPGAWVRINFEALKTGEPTELDPREKGEALWENRHSRVRLEEIRKLDKIQFNCLYQGNPGGADAMLYEPFKTYVSTDAYGKYIRSGCYVDVADEGKDYLFAATYDIFKSENTIFDEAKKKYVPLLFALITDMIMTDESTSVTTISVPAMINRNGTQKAWIESNNGGALFEKTIKPKVKALTTPFYQGGNKESRIITASACVNQHIIMPFDWQTRFPKIYDHLTHFLRDFGANEHDDAEDGLTGIYEKEIADGNIKPYSATNQGVRLRN